MKATIHLLSNSNHVEGIICGFLLLQDQGKIEVSFDYPKDALSQEALIAVDINGRRIVYDLMDGYFYNVPEAVIDYFDKADYIFKRSFSAEKNGIFSENIRQKIKPLGLNYFVCDHRSPLRTASQNPLYHIWNRISCLTPVIADFESSIKNISKRPNILFMTRLWDPESDNIKNMPDLQEQWQSVSDNRIELVRKIRENFPNQAFCGIYDDPYSRKRCPDLLLPAAKTNKRMYLHRMKKADICVSSIGLHESTGWRTAEFVAAGRSIVTEKLRYEVPGNFEEENNYFSFTSNDECIVQIERLVHDPDLILEMSRQNILYYHDWLRPDRQVIHTLCESGILGE